MELWTILSELLQDVRTLPDRAHAREAEGWDGVVVADTQCLAADPYVLLALAAAATDRVKLSLAVSNPVTRHVTVTASALIALQAASHGRVMAGMGRGDSALAYIGLSPVSTRAFEQSLAELRTLLHGGEIGVEFTGDQVGRAGAVRTAGIQWRPDDLEPVPINAIVSGPKSIAAAARWADRITVTIGADPDRIAAAKAYTESVTPADRAPVGFGAVINLAPHRDREVAHQLVAGATATFARFSAMRGSAVWDLPAEERAMIEEVAARYEMRHHGGGENSRLPEAFIYRFSVAGTPEYCIERLLPLTRLGLSHLLLIPPSTRSGPEREVVVDLINTEILPALRAASSTPAHP